MDGEEKPAYEATQKMHAFGCEAASHGDMR